MMSNISLRVYGLEKSVEELKCLVTRLLSPPSNHQRTRQRAEVPSWAQDITNAINQLSEQLVEIKQALPEPSVDSSNDDNTGANNQSATPGQLRQSQYGKKLCEERSLATQSSQEDSVRNNSGLESSLSGSLIQQVQVSTDASSSEDPDETGSAETGGESTANTTPEPVFPVQQAGAQRNSEFSLLVKETGENLVASAMRFTCNLQFSDRISITDIPEVNWASLAKLIRPPPKNYDLLGIKYSTIHAVGGAAGLALSQSRQFYFPDFSGVITEPSLEESLDYLNQLINDPPKGSIPYYVGPPLHEGPLMSIANSLLHPGHELLRLDNIPGVNSVYWHVGERGSGTAFHCEDVGFFSFNVVLRGWKLWIKIRQSHTAKFEAFIKANWPTNNCDQFVRHTAVICSPERLQKEKIDFEIILAGPGDIVLTRRRQYHMVVNSTRNLALAINFLPPGKEIVPKGTRVCPKCGLYSLDHECLQKVSYNPIDATRRVDRTATSSLESTKAAGRKRAIDTPRRADDTATSSLESTKAAGRKRAIADHNSQQLLVRTKRAKLHDPQALRALNEIKERILRSDQLCIFPSLSGDLPSPEAYTAVTAIWSRRAIAQFLDLVKSTRDIHTHSSQIEVCVDQSARIIQCIRRIKIAQKRSKLETFLLRLGQLHLIQEIESSRGRRIRTNPTDIKWIREKAGWTESEFKWQRQQGNLWKRLCQGNDWLLCFLFLEEDKSLGVSLNTYLQMTPNDIETFHRLLDSDYTNSLRSAGKAFMNALDSRAADSDFLWECGRFAPDTLPEEDLLALLGSFPSITENVHDPEKYPNWPRPCGWPEDWPWPVDPTALVDSNGRQCDLCIQTSCSCISANLKPMPRIKDYGKKGRGLQAVANGPGQIAYQKGDIIGQLTGELAPLGTYNDGWTLELARGDLLNEPSVCQIHCANTGNCFRLLNHHCSSNARFHEMAVSGRYRMMVKAVRDIRDGEEITVRYGRGYWGEGGCPCDEHPCS